jgi:prepilin-type N-terminal cleavage/methylation domain-containing protein
MKKLLKKTEGFTLVELIVVIAILGILAGVGVAGYSGYITKAQEAGDITALADETTSKDANGKETKTLKGYYIVLFQERHDNHYPLVNVRHILVSFEGGTYNSSTGSYTYTDDMAAAKAKAEELLAQWQAGEATEETFIELAKQNSSDGNAQDGGLYEKVYPGQMVPTYNDWCFDASRKAGDTGIVKTDFGYHIMYFVGQADINYRDYMITNELTSTDLETWYADITGNVATQLLNTKYIKTDLVLSSAQ